jgi:NitT/TauT family transport system substrate-binding protein
LAPGLTPRISVRDLVARATTAGLVLNSLAAKRLIFDVDKGRAKTTVGCSVELAQIDAIREGFCIMRHVSGLAKAKRSGALRSCVLAAAFALAAAGPASAAELTKLRALIPIPNLDESFAPVAVAKVLGYFQQEGLDVSIITVSGSNEAAIQVSAGNAEVALASPADAIIGMQSGKDLNVQYYYDFYYRNIWPISVLESSPIRTLSNLKAKKIGVLSMGSTGITFGRAYAKEGGLDPAHDVTFIPIGAGAQALTALRQGAVDAIVFNDAALAKFRVLGVNTRRLPVSAQLTDLPDTSILARREELKTMQPQLIGFARAVAKGYQFTQANPTAAVKITWKLHPEAEPKNMPPDEALKQGIAVCEDRMAIWSSPKTNGVNGAFIDTDWRNLVSFLREQGALKETIPLDRIYDASFVPEIDRFDVAAVRKQAEGFELRSLEH